MIAVALLLAAQSVPQSLLTAADDASSAYVQCLFATSRAADGAGLSVEAFERKLASVCITEEERVVRAMTAVLHRRGEANAASSAKQLADDSRRSVVETYRQISQLRQ